MSKVIEHRYEFVYLFDVESGNPNGDPDAGNMPRIDPETSFGLVTDVCLKRKIRNYVELVGEDKAPNLIYVKEKAVLSERRAPAYEAVKDETEDASRIAKAREWMCKNFYDVRTFGAVMSTKENNCGQVRGPVQLNFGRSIDPIMPLETTITRMAVETSKEAKDQSGDNRTMGRKHIVPYALYRTEGYVSPHLARQTGFTESDLELLWQALANMFDHDHSAARGKMAGRALIVFEHDSALGNTPAHKLFDRIKVERVDATKPARAFSDYSITEDKTNLPNGVTVKHML
ncbi:MAG TPA: type I-C CRISPR-associated protein Cas7/Csd2 [Kiritimatiellia bacterium]|nr:type I-C CRISPR-associated protein Cas7/Csd2 [Kiritimatiellia bacterium]